MPVGGTYAAVAANISIRRAFVANAKQHENRAVNAHTSPSLAFALLTKDRATIDTKGANEENTVPRTFVTASTWRSS
jgi:hypothetical protein